VTTKSMAASQAEPIIEALGEARERTLALVAPVAADDLERVHSALMSPLVWDLGHIAAFEDLWISHRSGGRPLLRDDLAEVYDAFETPRAQRGELPFLRTAETLEYLAEVRERSLEVLSERGVGDGLIPELIVRHEQQHTETMLQTLQLAQLSGYAFEQRALGAAGRGSFTGLELVAIPAGECTLGAAGDGFAYDNERPRQRAGVSGYLIGITPITNATFLEFVQRGGYRRRDWWSDEGWSWKQDNSITRPAGWTSDHGSEWRLSTLERLAPDRPVVHISWFEADAFARSHGLRLPTEAEWEKAATWDNGLGIARSQPWGDEPLSPGVHANVDQRSRGPVAAGGLPAGASPYGCLSMIGDVWEWTASDFGPYPGFEPFPYPEYSEVFFGSEYKVLRGGSWATRTRVSTPTFRNWDYPQRRQIFAGVRVAADL
jgi:gamma-glutamyl hercynylcysteine S-oxide synthase